MTCREMTQAEINADLFDEVFRQRKEIESLSAKLAECERERDEAREIIALCARDYLGMRDRLIAEPILEKWFPRTVEELRETGEWLESYKDAPAGAIGELARKLETARCDSREATARAEAAEARVKELEEALDILQAAMVEKKPISPRFKKAIIDAGAALSTAQKEM
jgi:DNA repair exonuclease SbcCD ATPase subunit